MNRYLGFCILLLVLFLSGCITSVYDLEYLGRLGLPSRFVRQHISFHEKEDGNRYHIVKDGFYATYHLDSKIWTTDEPSRSAPFSNLAANYYFYDDSEIYGIARICLIHDPRDRMTGQRNRQEMLYFRESLDLGPPVKLKEYGELNDNDYFYHSSGFVGDVFIDVEVKEEYQFQRVEDEILKLEFVEDFNSTVRMEKANKWEAAVQDSGLWLYIDWGDHREDLRLNPEKCEILANTQDRVVYRRDPETTVTVMTQKINDNDADSYGMFSNWEGYAAYFWGYQKHTSDKFPMPTEVELVYIGDEITRTVTHQFVPDWLGEEYAMQLACDMTADYGLFSWDRTSGIFRWEDANVEIRYGKGSVYIIKTRPDISEIAEQELLNYPAVRGGMSAREE